MFYFSSYNAIKVDMQDGDVTKPLGKSNNDH